MQKNGQLYHFTYMILALGIKVIILHTKLSKLLNPCQDTCAFYFPSMMRFSQHQQPFHRCGTELNLQSGIQLICIKSACSAFIVYMCTLKQHGSFSMHLFCMRFAEYNLPSLRTGRLFRLLAVCF